MEQVHFPHKISKPLIKRIKMEKNIPDGEYNSAGWDTGHYTALSIKALVIPW